MTGDKQRVEQILLLVLSATPENVGDVYVSALDIYKQISNAWMQQLGEYHVAQIRDLARRAEIGWKLFYSPPHASHRLDIEHQVQLITLIATLDSFCYGSERLDQTSFLTSPASAPVRFYINSLYHFIAAMYLLDRGSDPMGGMIYKTLRPMALNALLTPIQDVLDEPMEGGITFGETVRRIRNNFMVHGTFSPADVSSVVAKTKLQDFTQLLRLTNLIWELFNRSFVLKLQLLAVLTDLGADPQVLVSAYVAKAEENKN